MLDAARIAREHRHPLAASIIDRPHASSSELTAKEASIVISAVQTVVDGTARIEQADDGTPRIVRIEQHEDV